MKFQDRDLCPRCSKPDIGGKVYYDKSWLVWTCWDCYYKGKDMPKYCVPKPEPKWEKVEYELEGTKFTVKKSKSLDRALELSINVSGKGCWVSITMQDMQDLIDSLVTMTFRVDIGGPTTTKLGVTCGICQGKKLDAFPISAEQQRKK